MGGRTECAIRRKKYLHQSHQKKFPLSHAHAKLQGNVFSQLLHLLFLLFQSPLPAHMVPFPSSGGFSLQPQPMLTRLLKKEGVRFRTRKEGVEQAIHNWNYRRRERKKEEKSLPELGKDHRAVPALHTWKTETWLSTKNGRRLPLSFSSRSSFLLLALGMAISSCTFPFPYPPFLISNDRKLPRYSLTLLLPRFFSDVFAALF